MAASTVGGAATTLLGVVAGALLGRRTQERHWLKDTKAAAYAAVLREYTRAEFDLRRAYSHQETPRVDWPQWGAAITALSLVADDQVVAAASRITELLVRMEAFAHSLEPHDDEWRRVQRTLVDAQMAFVNTARQSLDRSQPPLSVRIGGPLLAEPDSSGSPTG